MDSQRMSSAAQLLSMSSQEACLWVQQADAGGEPSAFLFGFLFFIFWSFPSPISGSCLDSYSA